jgi:UPF0042 nucleotide-binding protein
MSTARVVFVAGLSGAGKSQAMKTFEDLGFFSIEHLPPAALGETLNVLDAARRSDVAISLDTHGDALLGDALAALDAAASNGRDVSLLYLEARNDTLVRRFSETRRRHPFAAHGSLREAIAAERESLLPLRARANVTIDTTTLTHGDLKERIFAAFAPDSSAMAVSIVAFGFKYGLPLDLDLLFDVRFLRNPNYDAALQPLTGNNRDVARFIEADPGCAPFIAKLTDLMDFLLPRYIAEGKAQLTIGVGCTGGRHRSVYVAQRLVEHLARAERTTISVDARDVGR